MRGAGAGGRRARAAVAVRHLEARGGGVPALVQPALRHAPHRAALRERLRAAPGSARRGGRRRDLPRRALARRAGEDLRRRAADARLRVRRRRRACDDVDGRPGSRRLQRRHGTRDVGRRALRALRPRRRLGHPAEHAPARLGELQRSFLDPTRAAHELGFTAMVELEDGLRATWDWIQKD